MVWFSCLCVCVCLALNICLCVLFVISRVMLHGLSVCFLVVWFAIVCVDHRCVCVFMCVFFVRRCTVWLFSVCVFCVCVCLCVVLGVFLRVVCESYCAMLYGLCVGVLCGCVLVCVMFNALVRFNRNLMCVWCIVCVCVLVFECACELLYCVPS